MATALTDLLKNPQNWEFTPDWGSPLNLSSFQPVLPENGYTHSFEFSFAFAEEDLDAKLLVLPTPSEKWEQPAQLEINSELVNWKDPYSYVIGAPTAELSQWVAWVFRIDGESRRQRSQAAFEQTQTWSEPSLEGMLTRVEMGISEHGRISTNSRNFTTAGQMQTWFETTNPNPHAKIRVRALKDVVAYSSQSENARRYQVATQAITDTKFETEPEILYSIAWATPTDENCHGMSELSQGWVQSSSLTILLDGSLLESYQCLDVLPLENLANYLDESPEATGNWYAINFEGLNKAILCPATGACLDMEWDKDGATLAITVTDEDRVVVENMAEIKHRKKWSRWYSANANFTEAELNEGIRQAETDFFNLMHAEDKIVEAENEND